MSQVLTGLTITRSATHANPPEYPTFQKLTEPAEVLSIYYQYENYHFVGEHDYNYQVTLGLKYYTYIYFLWTLFTKLLFLVRLATYFWA